MCYRFSLKDGKCQEKADTMTDRIEWWGRMWVILLGQVHMINKALKVNAILINQRISDEIQG